MQMFDKWKEKQMALLLNGKSIKSTSDWSLSYDKTFLSW